MSFETDELNCIQKFTEKYLRIIFGSMIFIFNSFKSRASDTLLLNQLNNKY